MKHSPHLFHVELSRRLSGNDGIESDGTHAIGLHAQRHLLADLPKTQHRQSLAAQLGAHEGLAIPTTSLHRSIACSHVSEWENVSSQINKSGNLFKDMSPNVPSSGIAS